VGGVNLDPLLASLRGNTTDENSKEEKSSANHRHSHAGTKVGWL
jgi:hypothetical protein